MAQSISSYGRGAFVSLYRSTTMGATNCQFVDKDDDCDFLRDPDTGNIYRILPDRIFAVTDENKFLWERKVSYEGSRWLNFTPGQSGKILIFSYEIKPGCQIPYYSNSLDVRTGKDAEGWEGQKNACHTRDP